MLIRVRPFARGRAWPCSVRGGELPAAARPRADSRRDTSADAAAPHSRLARPSPHPCPSTNTRSWSAALIDRATLERAEAEAVALRRGHPRGAAGDGAGSRSSTMRPPWRTALGVPVVALGCPARSCRCGALAGDRDRAAGAARRAAVPCARRDAGAARDPARGTWQRLRGQGIDVVLASQLLIDAALEAHAGPERIDRAVRGLLRQQPASSAGARGLDLAGDRRPPARSGLLIGGFAVQPDATLAALTALIALPFLCVTALRRRRLAAGAGAARDARSAREASVLRASPTGSLPVYYRAGAAASARPTCCPGLVQSLRALDYPAGQARDLPGARGGRHRDPGGGAATLALPGNFRTLIVPDGRRRRPSPRP